MTPTPQQPNAGELALVGLSFRTAPIAVRDRVAVGDNDLPSVLERLRETNSIDEVAVISTCNRTEIYALGAAQELVETLEGFLADRSGMPLSELRKSLYTSTGHDAANHLFRVASGLDSMILGEPQVIGQTRRAYAVAKQEGAIGRAMSALFDTTLHAARRARTETGIARGAVSISFAAVELARQIFGKLDEKEVLILGAGKMSALTMDNLKAQGAQSCFIANRSLPRAEEMARAHDARVYPWERLEEALGRVDIVIASTAAPHPVLNAAVVGEAMKRRRNRPLFIVDIAVPRDVEENVGELYNVFLFNIDDLKSVIEENLARRKQEVARAEEIIDGEVTRYLTKLRSWEADGAITQLRSWADEQRSAEVERLKQKLGDLTPDQERAIEQFSQRLTNKFLDRPSRQVKSAYREPQPDDASAGHSVLNSLRHLFGLDDPKPTPPPVKLDNVTSDQPTAPRARQTMDDLDCRICDLLQTGFPLTPTPFASMAQTLNIDEDKMLRRVQAMKDSGVLRQISAIFDSRRLGYRSLLVAFSVPADRLELVAASISAHRGVSHSYERRHQFNLWFTLTAPPGEDPEEETARLAERTQTTLWAALPAIRTFKIGVNFKLAGDTAPKNKHTPRAETVTQYPRPNDEEIDLIRALQKDIPINPRPFRLQAERLGITEEALLEIASDFQKRKMMRRFAAVLRHREAGFSANGMACWAVSSERLDELGPRVAAFAEVSHCYERRAFPPAWPYTLFAMIHGREPSDVEATARRIREEVGLPEGEILYSDREFKKERVVYFPQD